METEWVLRGCYGLAPTVVAESLRRVVDLRGATVEDRPAVERALGYFDVGFDFADGMHLASSTDATEFGTFDRSLVRRAARAGVRPRVAGV